MSNGAEPDVAKNPKVWVSELKAGDKVDSIFQVTRINLRDYEKGKFLTLRLGDRTGKISAVLWDRAEDTFRMIAEGDLVKVNGWVGKYQQETQLKIHSIQKVDDRTPFEISDFLPVSSIPLPDLIQEFDSFLETIEDPDYKTLLETFRRAEPNWSRFIQAPGAKRWHHPYLHGLFEHSLCVVKLCQRIADFYPEIDRDLLVTGAVFHDCGKMDELVYDSYIDYSTEGRLIGHLIQGTMMVERFIASIPDFPPQKRMLLLHILVSHHGEVERSPILPMTMEACLLHHIENMDAQMAAIRREMKAAQKEKNAWTGYIKLIERPLYLGEINEPDDNSPE